VTAESDIRERVATACRILGVEGLVEGVLGHVSARGPDGEILVRCRGPEERGLARTVAADVRAVGLDGRPREEMPGWQPPRELPIHTELYRRRADVHAVVHAHPPAALLCGLAGLLPRPVFGAFNIPALRLALAGVPVYPRSVLIERPELGFEMAEAMGSSPVCLLRGHGITVAGGSVEEATVTAVNLEVLYRVTLELHRLGAEPPSVPREDLAELPDLGGAFNHVIAWNALSARAAAISPPPDLPPRRGART
jgi:ribulose-5-phosphate 4-epimerase/fuculose-1-phosphate aldolase